MEHPIVKLRRCQIIQFVHGYLAHSYQTDYHHSLYTFLAKGGPVTEIFHLNELTYTHKDHVHSYIIYVKFYRSNIIIIADIILNTCLPLNIIQIQTNILLLYVIAKNNINHSECTNCKSLSRYFYVLYFHVANCTEILSCVAHFTVYFLLEPYCSCMCC